MPITFVSKNKFFIKEVTDLGFNGIFCNLEDYKPKKNIKTFYILPGNSFGYMDSGLEFVYSQLLFVNVQKLLVSLIEEYGKINLEGQKYLPIGSSVIIDYLNNTFLVYSPCMLTPQNVHKTNNAYYCCISSLYNILENRKEDLNEIDIIIPSICNGLGGMSIECTVTQITKAINSYKYYYPHEIYKNVLINEPNLHEQPLYLQNSKFKEVDIVKLFNKL